MSKDPFHLQRFLLAQEDSYSRALSEVRNGRKISHWMWYIFPQYKGLGRSSMAKEYAIKSMDEAIAYFEHPILGNRLIEITQATLSIHGKTAYEIFGSPDDLKLKSCMTLFDAIQTDTDIFRQVLRKYFDDHECETTINSLGK